MPTKKITVFIPIRSADPPPPAQSRASRKRTRACLHFEVLERRLVLSTYLWTALGDGTTWTDPMNWQHFDPIMKMQEPGAPVPFSDVVFPATSFLPKASPTTINFNFTYLFLPLNSLTINDSYTFQGNPITIDQSLSVSNPFTNAPGGTVATILLAGMKLAPNATISTATGSTLNLANASDPTGLQLTLEGGLTKVGAGQLVIDTQSIFFPTTPTRIPVPVTIAGGSITLGATVTLNAINFQVGPTSSLNIADDVSASIRSFTGTGLVDLEGTTTTGDTTSLTILVPNAATDAFGGFIDGIGQFIMGGNGTLTTGTIDFSGAGSIEAGAGTLLVNGSISAGALQVSPIATFGGLGSWSFSGPVVFQAGSTFIVTLNGLAAGSQYTQLVDTNTASGIDLGFSVLAASIGYQYEEGDLFTIVSAPVIQNAFQNVVAGRAVLAGSVPFAVSTAATSVTMGPLQSVTTTGLASSSNPSHPGAPITFTATVNIRTNPVTTGTVSFLQGTTALATVPVSGGTASFTTSALPLGSSAITAVYNGAGGNLASTSLTMSQSVVPYSTVTNLASAANPTSLGQPVMLTATVDSAAGPITSGTVTFQRGGQTLGTVALGGSGSASLAVTTLPIGVARIQAIFNGSPAFLSSISPVIKQTVTRVMTITIGNISTTTRPNGSQRYILVASVATIADTSATPTGTVIFRRNGAIVGRAKIKNGTAVFVLGRKARPQGKFIADFQGNARFLASKSLPFFFVA
jgi:hypothetical protein